VVTSGNENADVRRRFITAVLYQDGKRTKIPLPAQAVAVAW